MGKLIHLDDRRKVQSWIATFINTENGNCVIMNAEGNINEEQAIVELKKTLFKEYKTDTWNLDKITLV